MTITTRAVRATLLSAATVLLALGHAAPARAACPFPANHLYLTVTKGDARSSDTRGTLLLCDPPQGHDRAMDACAELARADGDVARIPHKDAICTQIYAPVRASAHGEWNGRQVAYTETFANSCVLAARTGAVFALSG